MGPHVASGYPDVDNDEVQWVGENCVGVQRTRTTPVRWLRHFNEKGKSRNLRAGEDNRGRYCRTLRDAHHHQRAGSQIKWNSRHPIRQTVSDTLKADARGRFGRLSQFDPKLPLGVMWNSCGSGASEHKAVCSTPRVMGMPEEGHMQATHLLTWLGHNVTPNQDTNCTKAQPD